MPSAANPVPPADDQIPYGTDRLVEATTLVRHHPKTVRCYVRGCQRTLQAPTRSDRGTPCDVHGIRCHHSGWNRTYSYGDVRRNIIASRELFAERIVGHPFKYESHRLGHENSEDALSWNVFRSLQEARCLGRLAAAITGEEHDCEPDLYLWGIRTSDDSFEVWPLLNHARDRFEARLPVKRPHTEPDIALHLSGRYLILIEAKFTSPNTYYTRGSRRDRQSLTLGELLEIYHDRQLGILDYDRAARAPRVAYQLWRNTVFAEWMAREDAASTRAYHVNLVRSGYERETAQEFAQLLHDSYRDRFCRWTWERIYEMFQGEQRLQTLRRYLETKTAGLAPAFRLGVAPR